MKRIPAAHGRLRLGSAGFTLVELLVAMSLLAVIMVVLVAALRNAGQVEERVDARLGRAEDVRLSVGLLQTVLERVSTRKLRGPQPAGANTVFFQGSAEAVAWIGVMPAGFGPGGRHFFRLSVERGGDASPPALVLRYLPWSDLDGFPDWSQAPARTLQAGVTAFALQYEDGRAAPGIWLPEWANRDRPPTRIALRLVAANDPWPPLVVALRSMGPSTGGGGFVLGGST